VADEPTLFDADADAVRVELAEPAPKLSAEQRRTRLQRERLDGKVHPLSATSGHPIWLHPDAPPASDRTAPGPRCGSCWYRTLLPYHGSTYPKCLHPEYRGADEVEKLGYPRVSHGTASDVRRWWPACDGYSPGDPGVSGDAARSILGAVTR
jgi:hypothetical protein